MNMPGQGEAAVAQLGHGADEGARGQQRVGDADELAHAAVQPAGVGQARRTLPGPHARERVTQRKVQQAFHGGEQQLHGASYRKTQKP